MIDYELVNLSKFKCVIYDEAHHYASKMIVILCIDVVGIMYLDSA